jgi:hypothetical protein
VGEAKGGTERLPVAEEAVGQVPSSKPRLRSHSDNMYHHLRLTITLALNTHGTFLGQKWGGSYNARDAVTRATYPSSGDRLWSRCGYLLIVVRQWGMVSCTTTAIVNRNIVGRKSSRCLRNIARLLVCVPFPHGLRLHYVGSSALWYTISF